MGVKSKSASFRSVARRRAAKPAARRARKAENAPEAWEQTAEFSGERNDEIDCQRIFESNGRSLRPHYDDYN